MHGRAGPRAAGGITDGGRCFCVRLAQRSAARVIGPLIQVREGRLELSPPVYEETG